MIGSHGGAVDRRPGAEPGAGRAVGQGRAEARRPDTADEYGRHRPRRLGIVQGGPGTHVDAVHETVALLDAAEAAARLGYSLSGGVPAFACTPDAFPDLLAPAINRGDIVEWADANEPAKRGMG